MFIRKISVLLALILGFPAISWGFTNTCGEFSQKIVGCQTYSCKFTHPLMNSFTVEKKILGKSGDRCQYEETMPNGGLMKCAYKTDSLKMVAGEWSKFQSGQTVTYSTNSTKESFNPVKTGECKISGYGIK